MGKGRIILAALAAAAGLGAGAAAATAAAGPIALSRLGLGRWQLHEIGSTDTPRLLCMRDPVQMIQLYHPGIQCTHFTIDDAPDRTTIHYTCQGRGYGRTSITVENANLIRLDTQGIDPAGQPFEIVYEGRRTGDCGPPPRR